MDTVNTELIRGHVDTIILNSLEERDRYNIGSERRQIRN